MYCMCAAFGGVSSDCVQKIHLLTIKVVIYSRSDPSHSMMLVCELLFFSDFIHLAVIFPPLVITCQSNTGYRTSSEFLQEVFLFLNCPFFTLETVLLKYVHKSIFMSCGFPQHFLRILPSYCRRSFNFLYFMKSCFLSILAKLRQRLLLGSNRCLCVFVCVCV